MALPSPTSPKVLIQVPAFAFAILGFILLWAALATPAWQVTYAREIQQWVQSGLWITCQTRPSGMYTCTWMFSQNDFDFYTSPDVASYRTPAFYPWQRTLLHIFLAVQLCALIALISFCVSNSSGMERSAVAVFTIFMTIATLTSFVLLVAFLVLSHMVEYRFYTVSVSGIYEKHRGYSFYLGLTAAICYFISLILSVIYLIRVMSDSHASGGLQRMAKDRSVSTAYTFNSRDDYRMATSNDDFNPTFSFQPSYRSSHQFSGSIDDHFAMKPLPATPRSQYY